MSKFSLFFQAFLCCTILTPIPPKAKVSVEFNNRPESGIPSEALRQVVSLKQPPSWSNVAGKKVERLRVRYYNPSRWSSKQAVSFYLDQLVAEDAFRVRVWQKSVWAQSVAMPDIECLVDFTSAEQTRILNEKQTPREGKLLVWGNVGCFRDSAATWHFLTITELSDAQ